MAEQPSEGEGRRRLPPRRADQLPPGRHGLSADEVATSQRERVLSAMTQAVGQRGYHAASISDVIGIAGVSRKTFYQHFEDKEECFIAAYERTLARLLTLTVEAFATQDEWADRVRAALSALLRALADDPSAARVCFIEVMAAGPKAVAARNEAMRGFTYLFEPDLGGKRRPPASLPLAMVGGLSEILHREVAAGRSAELPELLPDLMYTVVLPILGSEAAERELTRDQRVGGVGETLPHRTTT